MILQQSILQALAFQIRRIYIVIMISERLLSTFKQRPAKIARRKTITHWELPNNFTGKQAIQMKLVDFAVSRNGHSLAAMCNSPLK